MKKEYLLILLAWMGATLFFGFTQYRESQNAKHAQAVATIKEAERAEAASEKAAMFQQGIWYYRTTVLGQTLPQE